MVSSHLVWCRNLTITDETVFFFLFLLIVQYVLYSYTCSGDQADIYVGKNEGLALADWEFEYASQGNIALIMEGESELVEEINKAIAEVNEQGLYQQWKEEATELALSLGIEVN